MNWKQKYGELPFKDWEFPLSPAKYYPAWMWKQRYGELPFKKEFPPLSAAKLWFSEGEYISVYDMKTKQEMFQRNGERILHPLSCVITEKFNGTWELILTHEVDDQGNWQFILEMNIIKVQGQLFTIYQVDHNYESNSGTVTAYARHISYQIADDFIYTARIKEDNIAEAMAVATRKAVTDESPEATKYKFTFFSDIDMSYSAEIRNKTPLQVLMGNDADSIISRTNGELYRDNFYYSINKKMEGSRENAFDIRVGLNLRGIKRTVDYSNFATTLTVTNNFGAGWKIGYPSYEGMRFPHQVIRAVELRYSDDPGMDAFIHDAEAIWADMSVPAVTYIIKVADLRKNPDYNKFKMFRLKVGDTGRIFDERLGININAKIIATVTNGITGEVIEVVFGNKTKSIIRSDRYANNISQNTPAEKEADRLRRELKETQLKMLGTHGKMHAFKHRELHKFMHIELREGEYHGR